MNHLPMGSMSKNFFKICLSKHLKGFHLQKDLHVEVALMGEGGNNDFNVLDCSPRKRNLLWGNGNDITFEVNGHLHQCYYLLINGIYPPWAFFLQPFYAPQGEKKEHYTKMHSAIHKDVEQAFGVLQARWEIVKNPCRQWDLDTINNIMMCCIILCNMIVQDEQGEDLEPIFDQGIEGENMRRTLMFGDLNASIRKLENRHTHFALCNDVMNHLWHLRGEGWA